VELSTILVVDDSPTMRRMVRAALTPLANSRFIEAGSGLEAVETLALEPVTVVLLDLSMPDMHGLEVLQFLRSHTQYRDLPVIVLTTRGDEPTRDAALRAGASVYMTKPFQPDRLLATVKQFVETAVPARRT
jgi:two-component system chemotaxis response regulator CheY